MNTGHFGEGTISLDWTGVEGYPGLLPRLVIVGKLVARGYGVGAVVQVSADVTAWDIVGTYAFLGTTTAVPFVLNWVKQQFVQPNPAPEDETTWDVRLYLPMSPSLIEGLEARRAGKEFSLTIDATVLLIDGGEPKGPRPRRLLRDSPYEDCTRQAPGNAARLGQRPRTVGAWPWHPHPAPARCHGARPGSRRRRPAR